MMAVEDVFQNVYRMCTEIKMDEEKKRPVGEISCGYMLTIGNTLETYSS
jgi:hypothetical protein